MYTDQAHLIEIYGERRLVELTDRADVATGEIDAGIVTKAVTDASALIDGYLAARYKLPLSETPELLKQLAAQIAYYKLHVETAPEKIASDYKEALRTLAQIGTGVVKVNVAGVEPTTEPAREVAFSASPRTDIEGFNS